MFHKRIRLFSLVVVGLLLWLASMAYRNQGKPQVRRLTWENDGPTCTVNYVLWNPQNQPVYARTLTRLVTDGSEHGAGVLFGEQQEEIHYLDAKSQIQVKRQLHGQSYGQPEVLVHLAVGPEAIESSLQLKRRPAASSREIGERDSGYRAAQHSPRGDTER